MNNLIDILDEQFPEFAGVLTSICALDGDFSDEHTVGVAHELLESKHVRTLSIPPWRDQVVRTRDLSDPDLGSKRKWARDRARRQIQALERDFSATLLVELARAESYIRGQRLPDLRQLRKELKQAQAENPARVRPLTQRLGSTEKRGIRGSLIRFNSIIDALRTKLRTTYRTAYMIGIIASGVSGPFSVPKYLTPEETRWLQSATIHEMRFFNRLVNEIKAGRSVASQNRRIRMYGSTLWGIYHAGLVVSAHPDSIIWWKVNPKAEHCDDCVALEKNSPYTRRTLPTTPRAGQCRCLSNCKCRLIIQAAPATRVAEVGKRSATAVVRRLRGDQR